MRLKWILRLAALVAVLGLTVVATSADEGTVSMRAKLTGFQESPPKLSPSTGSFEATVTGSTLSYKLTYSKLSSPAMVAHIHFGQPAVNGGVFLWLCGTPAAGAPKGTPPCPPDGGTVSRSGITAADIQAVPAQNLTAGDFAGALNIITSGIAYVNVHTTLFPAGEIRGAVKSSSGD
jgi:CHRD domain-containing protein